MQQLSFDFTDDRPRAARFIPLGASWAFLDHPTMRLVLRVERRKRRRA